MAKLSGGGIQSNKNVSVKVRAGPANTNVVSPGGVSQLGSATGSKPRPGGGYTSGNTASRVFERKAAEQPMGNAVALNVWVPIPISAEAVA
jgi:hypothetical protein